MSRMVYTIYALDATHHVVADSKDEAMDTLFLHLARGAWKRYRNSEGKLDFPFRAGFAKQKPIDVIEPVKSVQCPMCECLNKAQDGA